MWDSENGGTRDAATNLAQAHLLFPPQKCLTDLRGSALRTGGQPASDSPCDASTGKKGPHQLAQVTQSALTHWRGAGGGRRRGRNLFPESPWGSIVSGVGPWGMWIRALDYRFQEELMDPGRPYERGASMDTDGLIKSGRWSNLAQLPKCPSSFPQRALLKYQENITLITNNCLCLWEHLTNHSICLRYFLILSHTETEKEVIFPFDE